MARPRPKADYLQHLWRFHSALWERGRGTGTAHFDTTWEQLRVACQYPDTAKVRGSLKRYAAALEELGLARVYGVTDQAGAWQRLDVELLHPPEISDVVPPAIAHGHRRVWHRHDLTACERRQTAGHPRAGRVARRRELELGIRRIIKTSNLSPPLGLSALKGRQPSKALPGRTHRRAPVDERSRRVSGRAVPPPPDRQDVSADAAAAARRENCGIDGGGLEAMVVRTAIAGGLQAALAEVVALAAAVDGPDHVELVELAWQLLNPSTPARLSGQRREQLRAAIATLDRFALFGAGRRGAGVELAVDRLQADANYSTEIFQSLSGVAAWLWSTGRQWRRNARGMNPRPDRIRPRPPRRPDAWEWPED